MIKVKIAKIFGKAFEVSENTAADIFVDYSPHCKSVSVRIYENGWDYELSPDAKFNVYYDVDDVYRTYDEVHNKLDEILNKLESMSQNVGAL